MRIGILLNDRIALPALHYLVETGLVVAIGMPDRKSDTAGTVNAVCAKNRIPLTFFPKRNFAELLAEWLAQASPDVVYVKTFPFLIPANALTHPRFGFINFHYAPLPEWRGASPLFWMLRNGERQGGISVHQMSAAYDAGPILAEARMPIHEGITFGMLNTQLAYLGLEVTRQLVSNLAIAFRQKRPQEETNANWYGRPTPSDLFIQWQQMEAETISALVRACNPWNKGAGTQWTGWTFGITCASVLPVNAETAAFPGTVLALDTTAGLLIACKGGKIIRAEVVYCEEGFYPGHALVGFGLKTGDRLG